MKAIAIVDIYIRHKGKTESEVSYRVYPTTKQGVRDLNGPQKNGRRRTLQQSCFHTFPAPTFIQDARVDPPCSKCGCAWDER